MLTNSGIRGAGMLLRSQNVAIRFYPVQKLVRVAVAPELVPHIVLFLGRYCCK